MSALSKSFLVHFRYDECLYADDLEHFSAGVWAGVPQ